MSCLFATCYDDLMSICALLLDLDGFLACRNIVLVFLLDVAADFFNGIDAIFNFGLGCLYNRFAVLFPLFAKGFSDTTKQSISNIFQIFKIGSDAACKVFPSINCCGFDVVKIRGNAACKIFPSITCCSFNVVKIQRYTDSEVFPSIASCGFDVIKIRGDVI